MNKFNSIIIMCAVMGVGQMYASQAQEQQEQKAASTTSTTTAAVAASAAKDNKEVKAGTSNIAVAPDLTLVGFLVWCPPFQDGGQGKCFTLTENQVKSQPFQKNIRLIKQYLERQNSAQCLQPMSLGEVIKAWMVFGSIFYHFDSDYTAANRFFANIFMCEQASFADRRNALKYSGYMLRFGKIAGTTVLNAVHNYWMIVDIAPPDSEEKGEAQFDYFKVLMEAGSTQGWLATMKNILISNKWPKAREEACDWIRKIVDEGTQAMIPCLRAFRNEYRELLEEAVGETYLDKIDKMVA